MTVPDPVRVSLGQPSPGHTVAEVDAALADVLSRSDYLPPTPSLMQRGLEAGIRWFREQVWERLASLFPAPDWSSPAWEMASFVALTLGALLGVALLVYLAMLMVGAIRRRRRRVRRAGDAGVADLPGLTAADWEARSAAAVGRGDWREAAHALYQAVLLRLADDDVIRIDASKTPGDYRREVRRARSELVDPIERFLGWFERLAYGPGGDAGAFDRLRQAAAELGAGG